MFAHERRASRSRRARRAVNAVAAVVVSALLLGVLGFGYGTIPAVGPALDPGRGAWTSAPDGQAVTSQALHVAGLTGPVTVSFSKEGLASISASNDHDVFLALGYVHAKFRLAEMDAERRLGEGLLAQLGGPSDVASDEFELRLGLLRTARNEWAQTTGAARAALLAYSQGVNDDISAVRADGDWPAMFTLAGVYPAPWTPVDSLVIQGVLTQELDYTTSPLDYALLEHSLGAARTMNWFGVLPENPQSPYDTGPYVKAPLTPLPPDAADSAPAGTEPAASISSSSASAAPALSASTSASASTSSAAAASAPAPIASGVAEAAGQLLDQLSVLPAGRIHEYPDSNAWAANGSAVSGGGSLLGGDPHLPQTLPSVWYEVALSAPGYQVAGVTVPGVPGVLLGHNAHIAWSLTNTQNEATLYYAERVRGDSYYWRGSWRKMTVVRYTIPVRGAAAVHVTVDITVHGPIMTQAGQKLAVDWMGNVASPDLTALLGINRASSFASFKAALAVWHAPTQNFVYADDNPVPATTSALTHNAHKSGNIGNIGAISAGYYPEVASGCQPWLPMPGTGSCDVTGVIPYDAVPQAYDPPSHVIVTANQRPVTAAYPYYIGTTGDFFDPGYRADYAYRSLAAGQPLTAASVAALQNNVTDSLAASIVPSLLTALRSVSLSATQRAAASALRSWDDTMTADSAAATVWWTFWDDYLSAVFEPWWSAAHVPVSRDRAGLSVSAGLVPLDEDLQAWTLSDPSNAAFRGPAGRGSKDAAAVMVAAFRQAVSRLSAKLGDSPSSWTWGRVHFRAFPSAEGAAGLGYGPRASGGDPFTEDAADGGMIASTGPSWRMIVSFGSSANNSGVSALGVYPGGQAENPASPWYTNLVQLWWDGQYLPLPVPGSTVGAVTWRLDG